MSYYILTSGINFKIHKNIFLSFESSNENSENNEVTSYNKNSYISHSYISHSLFDFLSKFKKQIEISADAWDSIKKFTNPYEFIHTIIPGNKNSISKLKPLSRSFYKMLELWKLFKFDEIRSNHVLPSINTFHLAEGPGGFIEATSHIRKNTNDVYYGMTLINDDPGCPGWKKSNSFLDSNSNVKIIKGEDGTGDLLQLTNYKYCKDRFLNSMDIITADGGIDVSIDFNKQEKLVSKLIIAEVIYAVTMQKKGGHFILKIFDIFSKLTVDLLYLLSSIYAEVYITKPYTSRLANSEKYIVCKNFLLESSIKLSDAFVEEFPKLNDAKTVASILNIEHDYYFLNKIEEINAILGQRQLENIITTLNIITNRNNHDKIESMKKNNIQKCISWCEKHDIPSIKLSFSNNIFLSNVYEDGTPVSTSRSNNSFLKKKNSTYTNTTSHAATASNNVIYVSPNDTLNAIEVEAQVEVEVEAQVEVEVEAQVEVGAEGNNIVNKVEQVEQVEPVESIIKTIDPVDNTNVAISDNKNE
jgi:23S rRNA U2552 (ribose-2'-O)-methylase RlmE/FtsJ